MKKIISLMIISSIALMLVGCKQEIDNETDETKQLEDTEPEEYYLPSGVEFKLYSGIGNDNEIDVTEYFDTLFNCTGKTVWDNCFAVNVGKSVKSAGTKVGSGPSTINGVLQSDVNTLTIDLTFYALEGNDLSVYSSFLFENEAGDVKREDQIGVDFASGVSTFGSVMGEKADGEVIVVEYNFDYVTISNLTLVTVKQFDNNDNLLVETIIPKDVLLESITLHEDAQYFFIIEDYIDLEGIHYQERIYNDTSSPFFYLYKFTNDYGFLNGDMLVVE